MGKKRKFRGHGIPSEVLGLDGRRSIYTHQDFSTLSKNCKSRVSRSLILSGDDDVCMMIRVIVATFDYTFVRISRTNSGF